MANKASAKKAIRKIVRRTEVNKSRRSRMRTFLRRVEDAIAQGDQDAAAEALRKAEPQVMRSARKGLIHKNAAARTISRLSRRVKVMTA
ncbi:MAG TPA: 30S ribosomal protein S20 [Hyphomicrobiales bacterium]|nr:30S ribosomal protein S20 [Hyphomicrobiales bacterium]